MIFPPRSGASPSRRRDYDGRVLRAILFDFNGVLVDDEPIHLRLFQKVLAEEGFSLSAVDYYDHYVGFDDRSCFAAVLEERGERPDLPRLMRLVARKAAYYRDLIRRQGYPWFAGAIDLVEEASAAGLMLGVISGALREEVEGALAEIGLRRRFKVLVTAEDVTAGKPDPECYRLGLERLNSQPPLPARLLHPHEVLAIEDTAAGLRAGAAAGLVTLGIAHTHPAPGLEAIADLVADRLEEMSIERLQALFAEASRR